MNTNYLISSQQYDDSGMRRALSAPDFVKVKSKLQTKIKNRMNPLFTKNRPHMPTQSISPKSSFSNSNNNNNSSNNSNSDNDNEEIPTSVLAAGPSLRLKINDNDNIINQSAFTPSLPASILAQSPHAYPFNQTFSRAQLQSLLLNVPYTQSQPYLNSYQIALFHAAALDANANALSNSTHTTSNPLKDHVTSFSMSSLSNRDSVTNNQIKRQRTSEPSIPSQSNNRALFIPQYGNRTLIQEENEMLLANEFKDANKIDEKIQNAFMYGDDDENDDEEDEDEIDNVHSYKNPAVHCHPKHMVKKISCFSDPYLMKSNLLIKSKDDSGSNRLNDRRGTLHAENENQMEFASNDKLVYKYTTGSYQNLFKIRLS